MEPADGAPVDLAAALRYVDGDRALLAELAASFGAEYRERLATLRAATEGGDRDVVEREAHNLKSVLALLGAERGRGLAGELERIGREGPEIGGLPVLDRLEAEVERVTAWLDEWRRAR
jgi:HPt (histidine-containing phosphotransfer) domain-containing protein